MSALAPGVRDRSFRTCSGDMTLPACAPRWMRRLPPSKRSKPTWRAFGSSRPSVLREMDRMGELERSLLRSCVAAEEDARVRCGAARRYATRVIAAAEEQAAASLEAPTRERDRIAREIEVMVERRREAAAALESLIAGLQRPPEAESDPIPASSDEVESEAPTVVFNPRAVKDGTRATLKHERPETKPHPLAMDAVERRPQPLAAVRPATARPTGRSAGCRSHRRPGWRRLRVSLAAGAAAALLLILQGSASRASRQQHPFGTRCGSFAPASAESAGSSPGTRRSRRAPVRAEPGDERAAPAALTIHIKPLRTVLGPRGRRWPHGCPRDRAWRRHRAERAALDRSACRRRRGAVDRGQRPRASTPGPRWTGR